MSLQERRLAIACRETRQGVIRLINLVEGAQCSASFDAIGLDRTSLLDDLGRYLRRTEELSDAALRPPCLGVIGLSGSGASDIAEAVVARTPTGSIGVRITSHVEVLDYAVALKPATSNAGRAVIQRFQARTQATSARFPVSVGLLRATDLVLILARMHAASESRRPDLGPDSEQLRRGSIELGKHLGLFVVPGMTAADMSAIREHINTHYSSRPLTRTLEASGYWVSAGAMITHLPNSARAELLAPLWGGRPQLTAIFSELMEALELVGYADEVLCPLDAVARLDQPGGQLVGRTDSILAAETAAGFARGNADVIEVQTRARQSARAQRSTLAALSTEVRWTVAATAGSLLNQCDVLQLPEIPALPADEPVEPAAANDNGQASRAFHCAKAEHLVRRAILSHELSGLVAVVSAREPPRHALAPMIAEWVGLTQGATPAARAEADPTLTVAITAAETFGTDADGDRVEALLDSLLAVVEPSGARHWFPDVVFDRLALLGRTGRESRSLISGSAGDGRGMTVNGQEFGALRSNVVARTYVRTLSRSVAGLMGSSGGLDHLLSLCEHTANTHIKQRQVSEELARNCQQLKSLIERQVLRTQSASGRLNRRYRDALSVVARIRAHDVRGRLGMILKALQVHEAELSAAIFSYEKRPRLESGTVGDDHRPDGRVSRLAGGNGHLPPGLTGRGYAGAALAYWCMALRTSARDPALSQSLGLEPHLLLTLAEELIAGTVRVSLLDRLARRLEPLLLTSTDTHVRASMVALQAVEMIGSFIVDLGGAGVAPGRDSHWRQDLPAPGERVAVALSAAVPSADRTLEDRLAGFHDDWCASFLEFVRNNTAEGPVLDIPAGDRDELQDLLKLFSFYTEEWG